VFTLRPLYPPLKQPPILTEEAAGWASELVWTVRGKEKSPSLPVSGCRGLLQAAYDRVFIVRISVCGVMHANWIG
jgi:hypothetical protein